MRRFSIRSLTAFIAVAAIGVWLPWGGAPVEFFIPVL